MINLSNKISIITGASSGIGRATAVLFSKLGSKLVLVGRDSTALDETIGLCKEQNEILKITGDLTDENLAGKIVEKSMNKFGKISILVNNAGIIKGGALDTLKLTDYDYQMNINVKSIVNLTQNCMPHIISEKGSVVNVSSVTGTRSFPGVLTYCISKAAVDQFTKCVALEVADKGVRVNSVNPGVTVTNLHRRSGQTEEQYEKFLEHSKSTHALGRPGTSDEVANTIAFLASDSASFITGELVHVDGGRHAMTPR